MGCFALAGMDRFVCRGLMVRPTVGCVDVAVSHMGEAMGALR